jgi:integrase
MDLAALPADPRLLRRRLPEIVPAQAGLSAKRLANIRADLSCALKIAGVRVLRRSAATLSPPWRDLQERLPSKRLRCGLSRFVHFCNERGLMPSDVSDTDVEAFKQALEVDSLLANWRSVHRSSCRLWNEAAEHAPGWPQQRLALPDYREPRRSLALADMPVGLRRDIDRYLHWLAAPDPFDDERPRRALAPRTITLRCKQIELAVTAFARRGHDLALLNSLADLVEVGVVKEILRLYYTRNEPVSPAFLSSLAQTLFSIAKDWVQVDEAHLEALRDVRRRLPAVPSGLTAKNRATMRQFEDKENFRRLLDLPGELQREAGEADKVVPINRRAAVKAQIALTIEMRIQIPIRMVNMAPISIGEHLVRPGGRQGLWHLVIPAQESKNDEEFSFELPRSLTDMVDRYLESYRPILTKPDNPHLFPGRAGGHKAQGTLAQQITGTIHKRTGLTITPHQFRHLSAVLYLKHNPGQFVVVQKHKNLKTTLSFYAGLDTATAARQYDDFITRERERLAKEPDKNRRRRSRHGR